jgi:hypothetical protein
MPFSSEKQRKYLWANEPKIAEAWAHGKSSVTGKRESASQRGKRKGKRMSQRSGRKTR